MSFSQGFQQGWGLADDYLNRQADRKRQKLLDDRYIKEQTYNREQNRLARKDRLDAARQTQANWQAEQDHIRDMDAIATAQTQRENAMKSAEHALGIEKDKLEIKKVKDELNRQRTRREAAEWLDRGVAAGHFVQSTTGNPNDARFVPSKAGFAWLAENGMGIDPAELNDNPMQVFKDLRNVEGMLSTQTISKDGLKSFTNMVKKVLNKRGKKVTHPKVVQTRGGPIDLQGWDIVDREIIDLIPGPEGKTFAFDMKVTAKDPNTGQEIEYSAPATLGGDNDPQANVQQFTIPQIAGIVGMQRESLKAMMKTPSMQGLFKKAQRSLFEEYPEYAKFQQEERKLRADQVKARMEQIYKRDKLAVEALKAENKHNIDKTKLKVKKREADEKMLKAMGGEDHAQFTSVFYQSFNALKPILTEKYAKTIAKSVGVDQAKLKVGDWEFFDLPELARSRILADFSEEYKGRWFKWDDMYLGRFAKEVKESMTSTSETAEKPKLKPKSKPKSKGQIKEEDARARTEQLQSVIKKKAEEAEEAKTQNLLKDELTRRKQLHNRT